MAVTLLTAACGSDGGTDAFAGDEQIESTGTIETTEPQQLDCEREGYPCSWSEADSAAATRTDELLAFSSLLLSEGATASEVAARLESAPGVATVVHDPITVLFRVEGGMPVIVYVDPTDGGLIEGALPPIPADRIAFSGTSIEAAQVSSFTGCGSLNDTRADGELGPVGKTGEPKKALILGPWAWQMQWDTQELAGYLKLGKSDYSLEGGGVTIQLTNSDQPSILSGGAAVTLESFCGWENYDTIMLKTHGRTICDNGSCHTSLSVGRFSETEAELRQYAGTATGVTFATSEYGNLQSGLSPQQQQACIQRLEVGDGLDCLEQLPSAGHIEITTDFFRANYASGLKDRLIFFSACQGMKEGDLARALRGSGESTGAILGFDRIIYTSISNKVMVRFAEWVAMGRVIDQSALDHLNSLVDDHGGHADVTGTIEGEFTLEEIADVVPSGSGATRGADIVSLHVRPGGAELEDGGSVEVDGQPGDEENDKLKLGVRLTGVGDEGRDAYEIEILIDDRPVTYEELRWRSTEFEGAFDAELVVLVGQDLVPDEPIKLEIRTALPDTDGAMSRWVYEDIDVGSEPKAVITIGGGTWEFELFPLMGSTVCQLPAEADDSFLMASGFVDGDTSNTGFSAHLEPDGQDQEGRFSVHYIVVDDPDTGRKLTADHFEYPSTEWLADIPAGGSQIDTLTIEGGYAYGTATFIDTRGMAEAWPDKSQYPSPVEGSFEINCG